jgi:hypothetical protein
MHRFSVKGHNKKRHLHAHSPVNFKELKSYCLSSFERFSNLSWEFQLEYTLSGDRLYE